MAEADDDHMARFLEMLFEPKLDLDGLIKLAGQVPEMTQAVREALDKQVIASKKRRLSLVLLVLSFFSSFDFGIGRVEFLMECNRQ
ncbi:unnamed protein product [Linum trigynum]|uniref:Uncharacterized protein n=1 Tax=Linum trigynum TaxID=586398 RepID=A0AAV2EK03_9ROSI